MTSGTADARFCDVQILIDGINRTKRLTQMTVGARVMIDGQFDVMVGTGFFKDRGHHVFESERDRHIPLSLFLDRFDQ